MKQRKTLMMLGLFLVISFLVSSMMANATDTNQRQSEKANTNNFSSVKSASTVIGTQRPLNTQFHEENAWSIRQQTYPVLIEDDLELEELEEVNIDELVKNYENLPEIPKIPRRCIWVVWAKGFSWKRIDLPQVDDVANERIPMGMKLAAKPIWYTEEWTLYKIFRGSINCDGETFSVKGYALKKANGRFWMSLKDDDGIEIEAVGKIYHWNTDITSAKRGCKSHRIAIKGRMTLENEKYVFALKGCAFRLCLRAYKPIVKPEETTN